MDEERFQILEAMVTKLTLLLPESVQEELEEEIKDIKEIQWQKRMNQEYYK